MTKNRNQRHSIKIYVEKNPEDKRLKARDLKMHNKWVNGITKTLSYSFAEAAKYSHSLPINLPKNILVHAKKIRDDSIAGETKDNTVYIDISAYKDMGISAHELFHTAQNEVQSFYYHPPYHEGGACLFSASFVNRHIKNRKKRAAHISHTMEWNISASDTDSDTDFVTGRRDSYHIYYALLGNEDWRGLFERIMMEKVALAKMKLSRSKQRNRYATLLYAYLNQTNFSNITLERILSREETQNIQKEMIHNMALGTAWLPNAYLEDPNAIIAGVPLKKTGTGIIKDLFEENSALLSGCEPVKVAFRFDGEATRGGKKYVLSIPSRGTISYDYLMRSELAMVNTYINGVNMAQIALVFDRFDEKKTIKRFHEKSEVGFITSLAETIRGMSAEEARNLFNSLLRERQRFQYSLINPRSKLNINRKVR